MTSPIDNLEPQALLLLYLAEELSDADRARVEAMLRRDPAMQAQLEELRRDHEEVGRALAELDAAEPAAHSPAVVVRHIVRQMRQHRLDLARRRPSVSATVAASRRHWVLYPAGAAAAAVFVLLGLWGTGLLEPTGSSRPLVMGGALVAAADAALLEDLTQSFELGMSLDFSEADEHLEMLQNEPELLLNL